MTLLSTTTWIALSCSEYGASHHPPRATPGGTTAVLRWILPRGLSDYGIPIPGDVAGAFRTLTSLDGTLRAFDSNYGLFRTEVLPDIVKGVGQSRARSS